MVIAHKRARFYAKRCGRVCRFRASTARACLSRLSNLTIKQRKVIMPQTITRTIEGQIIGGTFSNRENADKAVKAFQDLGVSSSDIEVVVQLNQKQAKEVFTDILTDRGFSEAQARF